VDFDGFFADAQSIRALFVQHPPYDQGQCLALTQCQRLQPLLQRLLFGAFTPDPLCLGEGALNRLQEYRILAGFLEKVLEGTRQPFVFPYGHFSVTTNASWMAYVPRCSLL
jgi:hypothetical protein